MSTTFLQHGSLILIYWYAIGDQGFTIKLWNLTQQIAYQVRYFVAIYLFAFLHFYWTRFRTNSLILFGLLKAKIALLKNSPHYFPNILILLTLILTINYDYLLLTSLCWCFLLLNFRSSIVGISRISTLLWMHDIR